MMSSDVRIISTDGPLFRAALELYRSRLDKEWSLTDCISFVVMQREDLKEALPVTTISSKQALSFSCRHEEQPCE